MKTLLGLVMGLVVAGGAFAAETKDDVKPLLGLPSSADFKTKCKFTDDQATAVDKVYTDYKDKAADAQNQVKTGDDKKAASKNLKTLKKEIVAKLREICTTDEQKTSFDDATNPKKKQ
jgi:hypothetical protein